MICELITIDGLLKDVNNLPDKINDSYLISYPEFVRYFSQIDKIDKHNLIIGANFTYGWMPHVAKYRTDHLDEVCGILNGLKLCSGIDITAVEGILSKLEYLLSDSKIFLSKLLHFIRPDIFAIWDTNVYTYFHSLETKPRYYEVNQTNKYLQYLNCCLEAISISDYTVMHEIIVKKVGYPMSKLRTIELIMFLTQKNRNS